MDNKLRFNFSRHLHNKFNIKLKFAKQLVIIKQELSETQRTNRKLNKQLLDQAKEIQLSEKTSETVRTPQTNIYT